MNSITTMFRRALACARTLRCAAALIALILATTLSPSVTHAQYAPEVFSLKNAADLYDERGYQQGKALSIDGHLVVSEANGNVSYSYPLGAISRNGYTIAAELNYCGSVAFTTYRDYHIGHDGYTNPSGIGFNEPFVEAPTTYEGWRKFSQNRPAWVLGVNGWAVLVLGTNTHFLNDPKSRLYVHGANDSSYSDVDMHFLCDGYDVMNRMTDLGAVGAADLQGTTHVDNIRLLRADGSVLDLVNANARTATRADLRPELYTGYYLPMEANASGYALVTYDSAYWTTWIQQKLWDIPSTQRAPLVPRAVHYFDGSGLEYVFREVVAPYGTAPYAGNEATTGGRYGGPTIFYLEEINDAGVNLVTFDRSRHYPVFRPDYGIGDDSTRGHALVTDFGGFHLSYGVNSLTFSGFGRSTKILFDKVLPSGGASDTSWLPIAAQGLPNGWAAAYARYDSTSPYKDSTTGALYHAWLGYVTAVVDPEGRRTTFTYEPYERHYRNFNFPYNNPVAGQVVKLKNLRLKSVTEPGARYDITYYKDACPDLYTRNDPGLFAVGADAQSVTENMPSAENPALLSNVVGMVRKYAPDGAPLTTDRYTFKYQSGTTFADASAHVRTDDVTNDTTSTENTYYRFQLPNIAPKLPTPRYTAVTSTTTRAAGVTTVTTIDYSTSRTLLTTSAFGSGYPVNLSDWGTPYLVLDTARTVTVDGLVLSRERSSFTIDTVRRYNAPALAGLFGLGVMKRTTTMLDPGTGLARLSTSTEFLHLPLVDTVGLGITIYHQKLIEHSLYDSLMAIGAYPPGTKFYDEIVQNDPRVRRVSIDTVRRRVLVPPVAGLVRRTETRDASGLLLGATAARYHTGPDPDSLLPLGDFIGYSLYGMKMADTAIGAAGVRRFVAGAVAEYVGRRPALTVNANGALTRLSYDYAFPDALDGAGLPIVPTATLRDNRDSVRTVTLRGSSFTNPTEEAMATKRYVRAYDPTFVTLDTASIAEYFERTFYGQVAGTRDANGHYSAVAYDKNGRVTTVWQPGDFQSSDTTYARDESGTFTTTGDGMTAYTIHHGNVICDPNDLPNDTARDERVLAWGMFADDPITSVPTCPECTGTRTTENPDTKGRAERGLMGDCRSPIPYELRLPAVAEANVLVVPSDAVRITSLDSVTLRLYVASVSGTCVNFTVEIPALGVTKTYVLNCEQAASGGGGGGNNGETKEQRRGLASAGAGDSTFLYVNLTPHRATLAAYPAGRTLAVRMTVSTPGGRVEIANGHESDDLAPALTLSGTVRKVNRLADYTAAFAYDDAARTTTTTAKVDDSLHTANRLSVDPATGSIARRSSATQYLGAEGRVLRSEARIVEDNGPARTDVVTARHNGAGAVTTAIDADGDTVRTRYDALGRAIETTNADGTVTRMTYAYGTPGTFGITVAGPGGQDFHGFCAVTVATNEDGVKFATYTDAFGLLRREIADSGDGSHLNLVTRYEYDVLNRLALAINPKGDTTRYTYDDFGRVQYKSQPDLGTISYAYDNLGNVRFTQTEEQARKGRLTFTEYDDLNRVVLVGEAILHAAADRPLYEDDGYEGVGGHLWGRVNNDTTNAPMRAGRRDDGADAIAGESTAEAKSTHDRGPYTTGARLSDLANPLALNTGPVVSPALTANPTLWYSALVPVPEVFPPAQTAIATCPLPVDTANGETVAPLAPFIAHPAAYWISPNAPAATLTDFENLASYPHFPRIAVAYDALPAGGSIWGNFPSQAQWNALAPTGAVRNLTGHQAAVAYREHGGEPYHYTVTSYDDRGRPEALLRYSENLGFDAVYYTYNALNQVTSVRVLDYKHQYQTWYGYDAQGRVDSVWTKLVSGGVQGLVNNNNTAAVWTYKAPLARPAAADVVYRYTKSGNVDSMRLPPVGVDVDFGYDHRKRLDTLVSMRAGAALFSELLTYGASGQVLAQRYQHGAAPAVTETYAYDATQRLTRYAKGPGGGATSYGYDAAGNRTSLVWTGPGGLLPTVSTSYLRGGQPPTGAGGSNRLANTVVQDSTGALIPSGAFTWAYDANGAAVRRAGASADVQEYAYSYRNLMRRAAIETNGGTGAGVLLKELRYRYSPSGEREQTRVYYEPQADSVHHYGWTYYLLGGNDEALAVYHGQQTSDGFCSGTGRRAYMYPVEYLTNGVGWNGVHEQLTPVITKPNGTKEYQVSDHLASLRVAIEGGAERHIDYDPWGTPSGAVAGERQTFNAQEQEHDTKLFDLTDRKYDAMIGGFPSPDRLWEADRSRSPYAYCANNPLGMTDPGGMQARSSVQTVYNDEGGSSSAPTPGSAYQRANDMWFAQPLQEFGMDVGLGAMDGLFSLSWNSLVASNPVLMGVQFGVMASDPQGNVDAAGQAIKTATGQNGERAATRFWTSQIVQGVLVYGAVGMAGGTAPSGTNFEALSARAQEIHGVTHRIAQNSRTTAILETANGKNVVASGGRDLTPAQRAMLNANEVAAKSPTLHAEVTALNHAAANGLTPTAIAVTRAICPGCRTAIEAAGGKILSSTTAIWPK